MNQENFANFHDIFSEELFSITFDVETFLLSPTDLNSQAFEHGNISVWQSVRRKYYITREVRIACVMQFIKTCDKFFSVVYNLQFSDREVI